jgi:hypothetical protein
MAPSGWDYVPTTAVVRDGRRMIVNTSDVQDGDEVLSAGEAQAAEVGEAAAAAARASAAFEKTVAAVTSLEQLSAAELKQLAQAKGVKVRAGATKKDLLAALAAAGVEPPAAEAEAEA